MRGTSQGSLCFTSLFIYFWPHWVFTALSLLCMHGLSLVVVSRGGSLIALHGLLIVVASLVAECGL